MDERVLTHERPHVDPVGRLLTVQGFQIDEDEGAASLG